MGPTLANGAVPPARPGGPCGQPLEPQAAAVDPDEEVLVDVLVEAVSFFPESPEPLELPEPAESADFDGVVVADVVVDELDERLSVR
ncbi:hypothetical protein [Microbispora triticiradicis]|uniref:hypothetical protein n=1 Tax=Microbispora triticiradicis TaxID=2200763 RepID=UPI0027DB2F79|nr:hypothetical protein [Microbispora triticiradicis]